VTITDVLLWLWCGAALSLPFMLVSGFARRRKTRAVALLTMLYVAFPFAVAAMPDAPCGSDVCQKAKGLGPNDIGLDPDKHDDDAVG
jgi:hypothetical protein